MQPDEIIERIMSAHWDIFTCHCWVCSAGYSLGLKPRVKYGVVYADNRKAYPVPEFEQKKEKPCKAPPNDIGRFE